MDNELLDGEVLEFSERLKYLRESKKIKQHELAQYVGVTRSTISGYETKGYQPSHEKLCRMAQLFNVSISYLVSGGEADIELRLNHQHSHKKLAIDIANSCAKLSYDSKLKVLEYAAYLDYLEENEKH